MVHKAAEQGCAEAQNSLGYCYEFGEGVDKNLKEAVNGTQKLQNKDYHWHNATWEPAMKMATG